MSQYDILDWLIEQRKNGNDSFFSCKEIALGLHESGLSTVNVFSKIRGLETFLEFEMVNINKPRWRVKEKYVGR